MLDVVEFLKSILTESELAELTAINKISYSEIRQQSLKGFFHTTEIFNRIKSTTDPTWLSYDIFINGDRYEF